MPSPLRGLWALIAAGGTGSRIGGDLPKQLLPLAGRPLIVHATERLLSHPAVEHAVIAMHPSWIEALLPALPSAIRARVVAVEGGESRQESVFRGLTAAASRGCTAVLVHDAARPLVTVALVERLLEAFDGVRGVIPVVPVRDSVVLRRGDDRIEGYLDRSGLGLVQTPQLFPCGGLLAAHRDARSARREATDDGSLFLAAGGEVMTVPGEPSNMKVTWAADLATAEALLAGEQAGD